jgi:hypothetical protein
LWAWHGIEVDRSAAESQKDGHHDNCEGGMKKPTGRWLGFWKSRRRLQWYRTISSVNSYLGPSHGVPSISSLHAGSCQPRLDIAVGGLSLESYRLEFASQS